MMTARRNREALEGRYEPGDSYSLRTRVCANREASLRDVLCKCKPCRSPGNVFGHKNDRARGAMGDSHRVVLFSICCSLYVMPPSEP